MQNIDSLIVCKQKSTQKYFKITYGLISNVNTKQIKRFLEEVDVPDEYYAQPKSLQYFAEQYEQLFGIGQEFTYENAKNQVQSNEIFELAYALKWANSISSDDGQQYQLDLDINPQRGELQNVIIMNIGLKIKTSFTPQKLLELIGDSLEAYYLICRYTKLLIQRDIIFDEIIELLKKLYDNKKKPLEQIFLIEVIATALQKYPDQLNEIRKIILDSDFFMPQQWKQELNPMYEDQYPLLEERESTQIYLQNETEYRQILQIFSEQYAEQIIPKEQPIKVDITQIFADNSESTQEDQEVQSQQQLRRQGSKKITAKDPNKQKKKNENIDLFQSTTDVTQSTTDVTQSNQETIRLTQSCFPTINECAETKANIQRQAPPLPINKPNDFPTLNLDIQKNIENTIYNEAVNAEITNDFSSFKKTEKKQLEAPIPIAKNSALEINALQNVEIVLKQLLPFKDDSLKLIDNLQFLEKVSQAQENVKQRTFLENFVKLFRYLKDDPKKDLLNKIYQKKKEIEQCNLKIEKEEREKGLPLNSLPRESMHQIEETVLELDQKNFHMGVDIEYFEQEFQIQKTKNKDFILKLADIIKMFKDNEELKVYFNLLKAYGKALGKIEMGGFKFAKISRLVYKSSDQKSDLNELIVKDMMKNEKIEFRNDDKTFLDVQFLADPKNDISEIKKLDSELQIFIPKLEKNIIKLEQDQSVSQEFLQKAKKYLLEYKNYNLSIQILYDDCLNNFIAIQKYFADDRKDFPSSAFFQELYSIMQNLRNYAFKIKHEQPKLREKKKRK